MKVAVIGGGAAGFFTAINVAEKHPHAEVTILEKTSKLLQKVKVSGGGRCNVTNARTSPAELVHFYPRGYKKLHTVFKKFTTDHMVDWLAERGVETKAEEDLRVFPTTNSSQTIIDYFQKQARKYRVKVLTNHALKQLQQFNGRWQLETNNGTLEADKVVMATGSSSSTWKVLENLGLKITEIVPSLFTFNITDPRLKNLQGISFEEVNVKIAGTKLQESGPLLITHWGLSGPAVLKLSSWGAYELNEKNYQFEILINYVNRPESEVRSLLNQYKTVNPRRKIVNYPLFNLPKRFWEQLTHTIGIRPEAPFAELSKKHVNKLVEELTQGRYQVKGKSTFKEEFVTAGGVSLSEINLETFECRRFPGLYLAGEVLDIDALTGGFNFQACWSGGWVIAQSINRQSG